jgi:7-carboxy-7-deazaguanine synthase (Cx14CxxC type)
VGGGKFDSADHLTNAIEAAWLETMSTDHYRYVVMTGGEPLLQLDAPLIEALHQRHFEIAIETNGTIKIPNGIDWVCLSPKANADLVVKQADEIKLVVPQTEHQPIETTLHRFEGMDFRHRYLQPMDGPQLRENTAYAVELCQKHPLWRLSVQTHKMIGIQ